MKLVNQQLIKNSNLKFLYNYIYMHRGISRTQLAKLSHLSKTTVSTLIDELIEKDFILDFGAADSTAVGRKPNTLQVCPGSYYVVVISWEDNNVFLSLVDITGSVVFEKRMVISEHETYISLSKTGVYEEILESYPEDKILGICVVVSAMIDKECNEIYSTTLSLSGGNNLDLINELKNTFRGFPVALLNDTACYAYAEKVFANIEESNFAFINFSRGVGATIFMDGKMLGQASGGSTQFGHYSVDPDGELCTCGNRGCLELVLGEASLKKRVAAIGGSKTLASLSQITFKDLGDAAVYGDLTAQKIIREMAREFSIALSNLVCLINPKMIIIGGKSKNLGALFLEEIKKNLSVIGFRKMINGLDIRYSSLNVDSYLVGAMKYFFDIHYLFTSELRGAFFVG